MKYSPLELFVKARKNTLPENIWVCVAAALTSTFYFYEYQYESFAPIRGTLLLVMTAVIFVIWIICSLFSGRDGRFGFAVFTFLYWGLPFIYTLYYAGRNNVKGYNKWLSLLNKICTALLCNPFSEASEKMNVAPQTMAAALVLICLVVYVAAFFLKRHYDARFADNSGDGYDGEYLRDSDEDDEPELLSGDGDLSSPVSFSEEKKDVPDLRSAVGLPEEEPAEQEEPDSDDLNDTDEDSDWVIK